MSAFLRFKQVGGSATGTIKTYAEKLKAFWDYLDLKQLDWRDFEVQYMAEFGYWYLTSGLLLDGKAVPLDSYNISARRNEKTVNLALTAVTQLVAAIVDEFQVHCGAVDNATSHTEQLYLSQIHAAVMLICLLLLVARCSEIRNILRYSNDGFLNVVAPPPKVFLLCGSCRIYSTFACRSGDKQ